MPLCPNRSAALGGTLKQAIFRPSAARLALSWKSSPKADGGGRSAGGSSLAAGSACAVSCITPAAQIVVGGQQRPTTGCTAAFGGSGWLASRTISTLGRASRREDAGADARAVGDAPTCNGPETARRSPVGGCAGARLSGARTAAKRRRSPAPSAAPDQRRGIWRAAIRGGTGVGTMLPVPPAPDGRGASAGAALSSWAAAAAPTQPRGIASDQRALL